MHRRPQFDIRENPASDRRHGSHHVVGITPNKNNISDDSAELTGASPVQVEPFVGVRTNPHAASPRVATGVIHRDDARLMTVREVADLLQVPSSWVYEHTRHRSLNRIPGIRLGKYWRFERADILRWIDANRKKDYQRVG